MPDQLKLRIVGGIETEVNEFPWTVGLYTHYRCKGLPVCGGSLISTQHILTAAHCIQRNEPTQLLNVTGIEGLIDDHQEVKYHPSETTKDTDIRDKRLVFLQLMIVVCEQMPKYQSRWLRWLIFHYLMHIFFCFLFIWTFRGIPVI